MSALIVMSNLPAPDCVKPVNFQAELDYLLDEYTLGMREENEDNTFPLPLYSDPAYQILSTVAKRTGLKRQQENDACHATMLAYAVGSDLDHRGANYNVERLLVTPQDNSVEPPVPAVLESDDRFRFRIQLAMESWTTAGSRGSYEYHVLTASPYVLDVNIDRPTFVRIATDNPKQFLLQESHTARIEDPMPGDVAVTLLIDPSVNDADVKALVSAALDSEENIPVTDEPHLLDAEIIEYQVDAILYVYPGPSAEPILAAAQAALEIYTTDHYKLNHDIAESGLHRAAHQPEVQRVELTINTSTLSGVEGCGVQGLEVQPWQAAKCTKITVTLGGRDV